MYIKKKFETYCFYKYFFNGINILYKLYCTINNKFMIIDFKSNK